MVTQLQLGSITVDVVQKKIKHLHLSVNPPLGNVRIAAPASMKLETIRVYAISKIGWIQTQQRKMLSQERDTAREYLERESHYVWGKRYLLHLVEHQAAPEVRLEHQRLVLSCSQKMMQYKESLIENWYRQLVRESSTELIKKWEKTLGVTVKKLAVQKMKTRWGGCNPTTGVIRLNTELGRKQPGCLEYVVVHEMLHLLEPNHSAHFRLLMDEHLPQWPQHRELLNQSRLRYENWLSP